MSLTTEERDRAIATLLQLTKSDDLALALKRCRYTGVCHDYGAALTECELSRQPGQRFLFEINLHSCRRGRWIGKDALLGIKIPIYHDGRVCKEHRARAEIARAIRQRTNEACLVELLELGLADRDHYLLDALSAYRRTGHLSPAQANYVMEVLERHRIEYDPSFIQVYLKRREDRRELERMYPWKVWRIWPALTAPQQRQALELGHTPPPSYAPKPGRGANYEPCLKRETRLYS